MKYFPFLRGKQNEMIALRELATEIAGHGNVIPIVEPVNSNQTTLLSVTRFIEKSMPFLFICNPVHGSFSGNPDQLASEVISKGLCDYRNWIPAFYVNEGTTLEKLEAFAEKYDEYQQALIYSGRPQQGTVRSRTAAMSVRYHAFVRDRVENEYVESIPIDSRIMIMDAFRRRERNAQYPPREFFTDMNTASGNRDNVAFGDFSIVGDYYSDTGGPAHAVALHHIHFGEDSHSLCVSHFISDRTQMPVDTPGKIIEAVNHLVEALADLPSNDTDACNEYRTISGSQDSPGLGYMKRLAIRQHLEVMLGEGGLEI